MSNTNLGYCFLILLYNLAFIFKGVTSIKNQILYVKLKIINLGNRCMMNERYKLLIMK